MTILPIRRAAAVTLCATALLIFLSCSEEDKVLTPAGPRLSIDVDSLVTVSWNDTYQVNKIVVRALGYETWFIADESGLEPPVVYRETPPGAEALVPCLPVPPPEGFRSYQVALIRSDGNGDHVVANGSVGTEVMTLPTIEGASFIYAPGLARITPPDITPEVWEFTTLLAVPDASWRGLTDASEVEALLAVRPAIVRRIYRNEQGVQMMLEYRNLRGAQVDVDGETVNFVWDEVTP